MIEDKREPDLSEPEDVSRCDGSGWDSTAREACDGCEECAPEQFYTQRERAAVVAWLRGTANEITAKTASLSERWWREQAERSAAAFLHLAEQIKRGEHVR